jgi:hypothetical protein
VIGGIAGSARGSAYTTHDLDIACARAPTNVERLAAFLSEVGCPNGRAPEAGTRLTFATQCGPLDIYDRPAGSPPYDELRRRAGVPLKIGDLSVPVASLDDLIAMKEATGRPRDKVVASELRVLADEIRRREA